MQSGLTLVAALDRQRAIGVRNALPWSLPADLKHFKALTLGKSVLMGRKTAESLGRTLPGRLNLVLTRQAQAPFDGMQPVDSLTMAIQCAGEQELMVIGGAEVYALALPIAQRMVLTHVDSVVEHADAWFPPWRAEDWLAVEVETHPADARNAHRFVVRDYRRRASAVVQSSA